MKKEITSALACLAALALLVSAAPAQQPRKGGTLVIGANDTIKSLAWYHSGSSSDYIPIIHMTEGLIAFDQGSFKVVPRLAEKLSLIHI